jgi:hypothetical protein
MSSVTPSRTFREPNQQLTSTASRRALGRAGADGRGSSTEGRVTAGDGEYRVLGRSSTATLVRAGHGAGRADASASATGAVVGGANADPVTGAPVGGANAVVVANGVPVGGANAVVLVTVVPAGGAH